MSSINTLGNRKPSRYDPDLAKRINKEVEEELRKEKLKEKLKKDKPAQNPEPKAEPLEYKLGDLIIDEQPADNGSHKTHDQWIEYWGNITDGRRFASMPDYLQIARQLQSQDQDKVKNLLESLRSDFNPWLSLNTRIDCNPDDLNARIIQNYKCRDSSLIREINCKIPVLSGVYLSDVKGDKEVQKYIEAISGISDIEETASLLQYISILQYISNKPIEKIKLWTPDQENRIHYPKMAVFFNFNGGGFHVSGDDRVDNNNGNGGRSRGVRSQNFP